MSGEEECKGFLTQHMTNHSQLHSVSSLAIGKVRIHSFTHQCALTIISAKLSTASTCPTQTARLFETCSIYSTSKKKKINFVFSPEINDLLLLQANYKPSRRAYLLASSHTLFLAVNRGMNVNKKKQNLMLVSYILHGDLVMLLCILHSFSASVNMHCQQVSQ